MEEKLNFLTYLKLCVLHVFNKEEISCVFEVN